MSETSNQFNHAHHLQFVMTPEAPTTSGGLPPVSEGREMTPKNPNKKRRNIILGTIGVFSAAALASSLAFGLNSSNQNQGEKPATATESSAPANPTESPVSGGEVTPAVPELTVESLSFDPTATPEDWGKVFVQRLGEWRMAGANESLYNRFLDSQDGADLFFRNESQKNSAIFAEAFFGPNWSNDAGDAQMVTYYTEQNRIALQDYVATFKENTPFNWTATAESSIVSKTDGPRTFVELEITETNNSAENRAGQVLNPELVAQNGMKGSGEAIFIKDEVTGEVHVARWTVTTK